MSSNSGPFLSSNQVFSEDPKQFLIQITKIYGDIARYLNQREISAYNVIETPTGQAWFNLNNIQVSRDGFRKTFSLGAIAAGATLTVPHGLSNITNYTHIYGSAITATPDFRPIPFSSASAVNQQIEIRVDSTNIYIINGSAAPNITSALAVLEYLKN